METVSTDINAGMDRLIFQVLVGAVRDLRSLKDTKNLINEDGGINMEAVRKLSPERRGEFLSAAGWVVSFVPLTNMALPREVIHLSRRVLNAEKQSPYYPELFAAAFAGQAWKARDLQGDIGKQQRCIRCGRPATWIPVLPAQENMPAELAWRMGRPENHIPVCVNCREMLFRGNGHSESSRRKKIDLAWYLWGPRFEAFWAWYKGCAENNLPQDWDVFEFPLWPEDFGGKTWETGSGRYCHSAPRGPKGIVRTARHRQALKRGLVVSKSVSNQDTPSPFDVRYS